MFGYCHVVTDHLPPSTLLHLLLKSPVLVPVWRKICKPEYNNSRLPKTGIKTGIFEGNTQPRIMEEMCRKPSIVSYTSLFNETSSPAQWWLGKWSTSLPALLPLPVPLHSVLLQTAQGVARPPKFRATKEIRASSFRQKIFVSSLEAEQLLYTSGTHLLDMSSVRKTTYSTWFVFRSDW